MEWTEVDMGDYSVFKSGDCELEPEDLDCDCWSLWNRNKLMLEDGKAECMSYAEGFGDA
jgi:hypothetical protein